MSEIGESFVNFDWLLILKLRFSVTTDLISFIKFSIDKTSSKQEDALKKSSILILALSFRRYQEFKIDFNKD